MRSTLATLMMLPVLACTPPQDDASSEPSSTPTAPEPTTPTVLTPDSTAPTGDTGEPGEPGVENVLLVVLDDIGVDRLTAYGGSQDVPPTPTIDALAADGMVFHNAWSMPLCSATRGALMTGRYPTRNGVGSVVEYMGRASLPLDQVTLPEMLSRAEVAWDSSVVGKWHVAGLSDPDAVTHPGDQGFAWYGTTASYPQPDYWDWEKNDNGTLVPGPAYATTDAADDAIARIAAMSEPWLLSLNFPSPHYPYHAPPPELVSSQPTGAWGMYNAMIESLDVELGRVLDAMDPDVRARTTIVLIGDNGTPSDFGFPATRNRVKGSVYEGGVRVPLVVVGPRVGVRGSASDAMVNVVDLFPTIAEIAGVEASPEGAPEIDGVSLLPVFADPETAVRDRSFTQGFVGNREWILAFRDEQYKLVHANRWSFTGLQTGTELYDLTGDPGEATDLSRSPDHQDVLLRLRAEVEALQAAMAADPFTPSQ